MDKEKAMEDLSWAIKGLEWAVTDNRKACIPYEMAVAIDEVLQTFRKVSD